MGFGSVFQIFRLCACRIKAPDKLRLAMLYTLRYEDTGNVRAVKSRLLDSGLAPEKVDLLDALLQYSGVCLCFTPLVFPCVIPGLSIFVGGELARTSCKRVGGRFGCLSSGNGS